MTALLQLRGEGDCVATRKAVSDSLGRVGQGDRNKLSPGLASSSRVTSLPPRPVLELATNPWPNAGEARGLFGGPPLQDDM